MAKRRRLPPEVEKVFNEAKNLSASSSAPRKHHLVPASYLERWAEGGQIRVTDIDAGNDYKTSPGRAARETDFYLADAEELDPDDLPPLLFEVLLGHIEGWGRSTIDELLKAPVELEPGRVTEFAWYLAMQFTRGAGFRAELEGIASAFYAIQYGELDEDGIRQELRRRGMDPTDELVQSSKDLFDGLRDGKYTVGPQRAGSVGHAGAAAADVGEHFLTRTWVVFQTSRILATCDEPVVLIGGPGHPRGERPGVATAAAVVFPLDPAHVLVLFRDDIASGLGSLAPPTHVLRGQLDALETTELSREIAMNAHRWVFERPSKRIARRFAVPEAPEAFSTEDVGPLTGAGEGARLFRNFKRTRWHNAPQAPWPVASWWQ